MQYFMAHLNGNSYYERTGKNEGTGLRNEIVPKHWCNAKHEVGRDFLILTTMLLEDSTLVGHYSLLPCKQFRTFTRIAVNYRQGHQSPRRVQGLLNPADVGTTILRNIGNYLR